MAASLDGHISIIYLDWMQNTTAEAEKQTREQMESAIRRAAVTWSYWLTWESLYSKVHSPDMTLLVFWLAAMPFVYFWYVYVCVSAFA